MSLEILSLRFLARRGINSLNRSFASAQYNDKIKIFLTLQIKTSIMKRSNIRNYP